MCATERKMDNLQEDPILKWNPGETSHFEILQRRKHTKNSFTFCLQEARLYIYRYVEESMIFIDVEDRDKTEPCFYDSSSLKISNGKKKNV